MTNPQGSNPATAPKGNAAMPDDSRGIILQRGGEEIVLEKSEDRFTVKATSKEEVPGLAAQVSAQVNRNSPPKMSEFVVPAHQRDQAMANIRNSDVVKYASHVYCFKDDPASRVYLTNQLTVQFAPHLGDHSVTQITNEFGLKRVKPIEGITNAFVFEVTDGSSENPIKVANRLMQRSDVLTAEPNIIVESQQHYRPRDPQYPKQWHLNHNGGNELASGSHIFAEQAWDVTRGNRSVVVAVMDDAIDVNHPDFQGLGKIVAPRDFRGKDFMPLPDEPGEDHGTSCAGVAVAEENGIGAVGAAPGCALMPIRTTGFLDDESIEELFLWAINKGASVISCSWGPSAVYYPLSLRQKAVLTRAATQGRRGKGCVIVFAAGNANRPTDGVVNERGWPRDAIKGPTRWLGGFTVHPDVITVTASTSLGKKAAYSNWGPQASVCAPSNNAPPGVGLPDLGYVATPPEVNIYLPGLGIVTTDRVGAAGYDPSSYTPDFGGTSSACPLVAGVAALVLSANPDLTAREVRQILEQTADKIVDPEPDPQFGFRKGTYEASGRSDWFGYGKVNAAKAVQMAVKKRAVPLTAPRSVQAQNNTAQTIPDGDPQGVLSTVQINDTGTVQDISVTIDIDHGYLGDLEIRLVAPSGQSVLLQGRTLGIKTKLQTLYNLQNTPALRLLLGEASQGRWQVQVIDSVPTDSGTLNWWQLKLGI
ncbi:S8 family serine peptidase [Alkalinema sp. FACHB-956]|uniref:S8 family serine peptidase n=1 Tax=Alkalinema sp. FACHB-956 TaxID=2692768 RepID=UPI0018F059BE|nr:S8 family serine peptidase [Alkalinema sp. FACHB-956]